MFFERKDDLQEVLVAFSAGDRVLAEEGLSLPEDSAGRLMQREIVTVSSFWIVGQIIDFLRSGKSSIEDFYLIFVIDPLRRPHGEIALSRLLCAQRPRRVSELMNTDFRSTPVDMDQEEVAVLFQRYGMVSAGVVDPQDRLVGAITNDDVIDVIDEESEENLLALAGVGAANLRSGLGKALQGRSSWLFLNLLTAVLASSVIGLFEATIKRLVALVVLMPIVASIGGNAGTQIMTVAAQVIGLRQLDATATRQFVLRELIVATTNGLLFAALAAGLSYLWFGNTVIAIVMAVAMMANVFVAGLSGTFVPVGLMPAGVDPAVASSVFVMTITDVVGFCIFGIDSAVFDAATCCALLAGRFFDSLS